MTIYGMTIYQKSHYVHIFFQIVGRILRSMQSQHGAAASIEEHPQHLLMALKEALALVVLNVYDR